MRWRCKGLACTVPIAVYIDLAVISPRDILICILMLITLKPSFLNVRNDRSRNQSRYLKLLSISGKILKFLEINIGLAVWERLMEKISTF